jgi:hypothetical protein
VRKALLVAGTLLVSGVIGSAQDKPSARVGIQGGPEQIGKAAIAVFVRDGFTVESQTASEVRISKPFSAEETAAYNTAHWTNEPVANCRHLKILSLSPTDGMITVTGASEMACNLSDGKRLFFRSDDEKESGRMQSSLEALKARVEESIRRH